MLLLYHPIIKPILNLHFVHYSSIITVLQLEKLFHTQILSSAHASRREKHVYSTHAGDGGRSQFEQWCEAHPAVKNAFPGTAGPDGLGSDATQGAEEHLPEQRYASGALWLAGQKHVAKGFSLSTSI